MTRYFNLRRLFLLLRNDILTNLSTIIVYTATVAGILFIFSLLFPYGATRGNFHTTVFFILLFLGGIWTTSHAFKELHDVQRGHTFLTLPCSNFEKLLAKLLLTSIGYVVAIMAGYFVLSLVVSEIGKILFNVNEYIFNPLHDHIMLGIYVYLILQSVFLLGSVYFKRHSMSKTVLSLCCFFIAILALGFIASIIFVGPHAFYEFSAASPFGQVIAFIFWYLLAPVCWVVTYFRLRESEI